MGILVGHKAPPINAKAVIGSEVKDFSLMNYLGKQYVILLFYPKNFTFVCPTELHAFNDSIAEFKKLNTEIIACSTDSVADHLEWLNTSKMHGGIKGITYPILADDSRTISEAYGVLSGTKGENEQDTRIPFRGLFLIDKFGIVQHMLINNMPFGRSVHEALRMVEAVQHYEQHKEVCPANWERGQKALQPNSESVMQYFSAQG